MMATSSLFRSEKMSLLQFYIPFEVAQATIHELGEAGLVHFRDVRIVVYTLSKIA